MSYVINNNNSGNSWRTLFLLKLLRIRKSSHQLLPYVSYNIGHKGTIHKQNPFNSVCSLRANEFKRASSLIFLFPHIPSTQLPWTFFILSDAYAWIFSTPSPILHFIQHYSHRYLCNVYLEGNGMDIIHICISMWLYYYYYFF